MSAALCDDVYCFVPERLLLCAKTPIALLRVKWMGETKM
jgi:hypothetical protein